MKHGEEERGGRKASTNEKSEPAIGEFGVESWKRDKLLERNKGILSSLKKAEAKLEKGIAKGAGFDCSFVQ